MKKKIVQILLVVFTFTLIFSGCSKKTPNETTSKHSNSKKVIKVGMGNSTPPFCYVNNNKPSGIEVDIWKEIGKKINAEIEFVPVGFDVLFGKLDNGDVDFIASYLAINPTRLKKYNFTEPYAHGFMKLLVLKSNTNINSLTDCGGKKIAVTSTSNAREFLQRYKDEKNIDFKLVILEDGDACINAVKSGQADAFFEGAGTSIRYIKEGAIEGKFVGPSESVTDTAYPYVKGDAEKEKLGKEVSKAIKELKEDGTLKKIFVKSLGIDVTDPNADMSLK